MHPVHDFYIFFHMTRWMGGIYNQIALFQRNVKTLHHVIKTGLKQTPAETGRLLSLELAALTRKTCWFSCSSLIVTHEIKGFDTIPPSMYGTLTYIWLISMVNVGTMDPMGMMELFRMMVSHMIGILPFFAKDLQVNSELRETLHRGGPYRRSWNKWSDMGPP